MTPCGLGAHLRVGARVAYDVASHAVRWFRWQAFREVT